MFLLHNYDTTHLQICKKVDSKLALAALLFIIMFNRWCLLQFRQLDIKFQPHFPHFLFTHPHWSVKNLKMKIHLKLWDKFIQFIKNILSAFVFHDINVE